MENNQNNDVLSELRLISKSIKKFDKKDSFVRWQKISIQQLGFTTNLIFTINFALIGFIANKLTDTKFFILCNGKALFTIGFIALSISFILGIIINITRLYDFRLTARTARISESTRESLALSNLKKKTKSLGKATWIIFLFQLTLFSIGITSLLISFIIMFSDKLF